MLKTVGDLTLCQKINDADWKRTDLKSVSGGVMANSVGTVFSGLIGGFAQNTASPSIGLSLATATTSRALAYPTGIVVIALAFVPKLAALFGALSGYMIHQYADRVRVKQRSSQSVVRLHFEH